MITHLKYFWLPASRCRSLTTVGRKSPNPFPYPRHHSPTPHQIFHLPRYASPEDIKTRYFELVRIYHPDSPASRSSRLSPETIRLRFHSITAAYAKLLGKSSSDGYIPAAAHDRTAAAWRANKVRRYAFLDGGGLDERWKESVFMGAVIFTIVAFVVQVAWTRHRALAEASRRLKTASSLQDTPSPASQSSSLMTLEPVDVPHVPKPAESN